MTKIIKSVDGRYCLRNYIYLSLYCYLFNNKAPPHSTNPTLLSTPAIGFLQLVPDLGGSFLALVADVVAAF